MPIYVHHFLVQVLLAAGLLVAAADSGEAQYEDSQPASPIASFIQGSRFTRNAQYETDIEDTDEVQDGQLPQPHGPIVSFGQVTRFTRTTQYEADDEKYGEEYDDEDTVGEELSGPSLGQDGFDNQDGFNNPPSATDPDSFSRPNFGSD